MYKLIAAFGLLAVAPFAGFFACQFFTPPHTGGETRKLPERASDSPEKAGLVISPDSHHFGTVWESRSFEWPLPIKNASSADVAIDGFETSCTCLRVQPQQAVIPSGQTVVVRLVMDLAAKAEDRDADRRSVEIKVRPIVRKHSGETVKCTPWLIQGHVKTLLDVSPKTLQFGRWSVYASPRKPASITVTSRVDLQDLQAHTDTNDFQVTVERAGDSRRTFRAVVTPRSERPVVKRVHGNLLLKPQFVNGEFGPETSVSLLAEVMNDVLATPEGLDLGLQKINGVCKEIVKLSSLTGSEYQVHACRVEGEGLKVSEFRRPGKNAVVEFDLTQHICCSGDRITKVVFDIRHSNGVSSTIQILVRYIGIV